MVFTEAVLDRSTAVVVHIGVGMDKGTTALW
jgi:hypothetical protein